MESGLDNVMLFGITNTSARPAGKPLYQSP